MRDQDRWPLLQQLRPTRLSSRKLTGVIAEFLHGLWNFDTKLGARPAHAGRSARNAHAQLRVRQARAISPLTMFLFAIFLMFFAFSTINPPMNVRDNEVEVTQQDLTEAREEELAQVQAELANARAHPDP